MADRRGVGLLDAYRQYVGDPFASMVGGAARGYFGLGKPTYANEEAYRTAQAIGNMPGFGAPAGIFKAAANAPEAIAALGGLLGKPRTIDALKAEAQRLGVSLSKKPEPKGSQQDPFLVAQKNAVKKLGLPPDNTAMDRAKAMGYADDMEGAYRGEHTAPTMVSDVAAPAHQLNEIYPDDVYSSQAARYYGDGADGMRDASVMRQLQSLKDKPDKSVYAYRAVPKNSQNFLQHGDWVTTDRQYAIDHGKGALNGDYRVISEKVPARSLVTDGNSIYEFGYDRAQTFANAPASLPIMRSSNPLYAERSRFAAFDPARAKENDLLGFADPRLLALIAAGTGGGLLGYNYSQDR